MGSKMRVRGRSVVLGLVASALLCGCGLEVAEDPPTPTPAKVREAPRAYLKVTTAKSANVLGNRHFVDTGAGTLIGPHFQLRQESTGTTREIGSGAAKKIGLDGALRAPSGYEFVVADFTSAIDFGYKVPAGGREPGSLPVSQRDDDEYSETVIVDGDERRIDDSLTGNKLLIVAVRVGEAVSVEVADSGRSQRLDLRTGNRAKDSLSAYYPEKAWSPPDAGELFGDGTGKDGDKYVEIYEASLVEMDATLTPFTPGGAWAAKGKAWLYVTIQVTSPCLEPYSCRVTFTPGDQVRLTLSDRSKPRAVGEALMSAPTNQPATDEGATTLAYQVPTSVKSARLDLAFDGPLMVSEVGTDGKQAEERRIKWEEQPTAIAIPLKPVD